MGSDSPKAGSDSQKSGSHSLLSRLAPWECRNDQNGNKTKKTIENDTTQAKTAQAPSLWS
jgi:hypothetical protein